MMFKKPFTDILIIPPKSQKLSVELRGFSKGRLYRRKSSFNCRIEFHYKNKKLWRPTRIHVEEKGKWKAYPAENIVQKMFENVKRIFIDTKVNINFINDLEAFLKDFGIKKQINIVELCPICNFQSYTTIITDMTKFKISDSLSSCKDCAFTEIQQELKQKKIQLLNSPGFKNYSLNLLNRLKNTDEVIYVLLNGDKAFGKHTLIKKIDKKISKESKYQSRDVNKVKLLSSKYKENLKKRGITSLLPIQNLSLKRGLLKNRNLLIIANTSAGKTLIGEMAGINHLQKKRKFIFTVPLVALANTKFEEFKKNYGTNSEFNYNVGLRVGRSRIFDSEKERKQFYKDRYVIKDSDIIVATYEGLDILFRAKVSDFTDVGCIVIDEIQSLEDPERGPTLSCLMAKIRHYFDKTQFLALSATVGNTEEFANEVNLDLVQVDYRPIPLEQHILISRSDDEKIRQMIKLSKEELNIRSKTGYRGQTIIFTNSRKKVNEIAKQIGEKIRNSRPYHSGLSYYMRKRTEEEFSKGKCPVVVATFALGAGVDFPASQVIFESLLMGKDVLSPNMFNQMLGRAGRLGKHDRGRVVLLCLGESITSSDNRSEIDIGFQLINSNLSPINPSYDSDSCSAQIISICSLKTKIKPLEVKKIYESMIGVSQYDFKELTNNLIKKQFLYLDIKDNKKFLRLTRLGKATSLSFFKPSRTLEIIKKINKGVKPLKLAIELDMTQNIYISKKLHTYLEKSYNIRFSTRLINGPVLDIMNSSIKGKENVPLNKWSLNVFTKWIQEFFNCTCYDNPYCDCGITRIGLFISEERLKGYSPQQITHKLEYFDLLIYPGDIFTYLNTLIHNLEGIKRICDAIGKKKVSNELKDIIVTLETPEKKIKK